MSWIAVGVGVGTAVTGYVSANQTNRQNARAQRGAGEVNTTTTNTPYGPSEPYRNAAAQAAHEQLFGNGAGINQSSYPMPYAMPGQSAAPATPARGGRAAGGGGGGRATGGTYGGYTAAQLQADPSLVNKLGASARQKWQAAQGGGAGGGGAAQQPFNGTSGATTQITNAAVAQAQRQQDNPLVQAAINYSTQTLAGNDQNAYRSEAADMLRSQDDPYLQRYLEELFGSDTGLGGGNSAEYNQGARNQVRAYSATGGPGGYEVPIYSSVGPVGVERSLRDLLAGGDSPAMQAMKDSIRRQAEESYNEQLRQRRLEASGSGMYGGTGQLTDENYALGRMGAGIADANAGLYGNLYAQALGLGTQYDIAAQDRAAQERISGNNASAASGAASAELASRERMARLGALGDAVGMSLQQGQFRTSGMGTIGNSFSEDQRAALGGANQTNNLGMSGWGTAGGISTAADANRNAYLNSQNDLAAARAAASVGRMNAQLGQQQLNFDTYRYNDNRNLQQLAAYTDIINGNYGAYGSQTTTGTDRRNVSPAPYISPVGQAISGGVAGYTMADAYRNRGGG